MAILIAYCRPPIGMKKDLCETGKEFCNSCWKTAKNAPFHIKSPVKKFSWSGQRGREASHRNPPPKYATGPWPQKKNRCGIKPIAETCSCFRLAKKDDAWFTKWQHRSTIYLITLLIVSNDAAKDEKKKNQAMLRSGLLLAISYNV